MKFRFKELFRHKNIVVFVFKKKDLTVIPEEARTQSHVKQKIYIPAGNRCCREHLIKNRFYDERISQ